MIVNPKVLGQEFVAVLQQCPNLVKALGGDGTRIQYYSENSTVFGQPTQANTRLAILSMPPGSVMIVWMGDGTGRIGNMDLPKHNYDLHFRVPEMPGVGHEDIWYWLQQDVPQGSALTMLHTNVDTNCEPMDFKIPESVRASVVIGQDGSTFEYFLGHVSFTESCAS
jgi:hypothetical protein